MAIARKHYVRRVAFFIHSPVYMVDGFEPVVNTIGSEPKVADCFRTGEGIPWSAQTDCTFCAVAKFFRPGYAHNLVQNWLPAHHPAEREYPGASTVGRFSGPGLGY